jgi:CBS-domain-containing membrane protein
MAYRPLPVQPIHGVRIAQPDEGQRVTLDSSALLVMTDLKRVSAAVISPEETMDAAHAFMLQRGVRMLLAVDSAKKIVGIVTTTDILGEKPVGLVHQRGLKHSEILVADVMTPAERLEAFDLAAVRSARVGDVVASLQQARRQHALVVQDDGSGKAKEVRGIFSLSQIARQLGMPLQLSDRAATFAELEAALT